MTRSVENTLNDSDSTTEGTTLMSSETDIGLFLNTIFRPSILKLTAYSSARSITAANRILPDPTIEKIYLDANELPVAPSLSTGLACGDSLNRYPSPQPEQLLKAFSDNYRIPTKNILITRGSDEAIDVLTRAVCESQSETALSPAPDAILITPPTYGMYEVSADIQNVPVLKVPLLRLKNEWHLDIDRIQTQLQNPSYKVKILYICSPNNPTGTVFSNNDILKVLNFLPPHALLVIDQAYFEFAPHWDVSALLDQYPQLVILRTLSKAWGLAGLRCGTLIGNADLINVLQKVRAPYPLPSPVIELALKALTPEGQKEMQNRVTEIKNDREILKQALLKLPITVCVYPSETNFLLVEFTNSQKVIQCTTQAGIIIRDRSSQIPNCVRITVGTHEQNQQLIKSLEQMRST